MRTYLRLVIFAVLIAFIMPIVSAVNITVDGDISDWGLSQLMTGDLSDLNTWIPTKSGISFVVEDNQDPDLTLADNYNPDYIGVHIYGNSTWQAEYHEPYVYIGSTPYAEPMNGGNPTDWVREIYDLEAIYITENDSYIFVLVVTSAYDSTGPYGDLALNFLPGGDKGYEFGINFHRNWNKDGDLYGIYMTTKSGSWSEPDYHPGVPGEINFSVVADSDKIGEAIVAIAYDNPDYGKDNMFIEIAIPKDVIGSPTLPSKPDEAIKCVWMSEYCGNDSIPSIPEFMLILIPAGVILLSIAFYRLRS